MTQPKFVADFAAEAAALGGSITFSALVAGGLPALVAGGLPALVAGGLPALVAGGLPALVGYVLALRGCRRLDVRRGLKLRRYGARFPRFRGRTWASVCRARLFFRLLLHTSHASVAIQARVASLAARHDGRGAREDLVTGASMPSTPRLRPVRLLRRAQRRPAEPRIAAGHTRRSNEAIPSSGWPAGQEGHAEDGQMTGRRAGPR